MVQKGARVRGRAELPKKPAVRNALAIQITGATSKSSPPRCAVDTLVKIKDLRVIEGGPIDPFGPQETYDPSAADRHSCLKVELWSKDGNTVQRMLWAGNRIEKARAIFDEALKRRPRGRYTIRQGIRVLRKWPET
jgi:hypothetical protein